MKTNARGVKYNIFLAAGFFACFQTEFLRAAPKDEIDFFNVGQGHAVLVNKVGAAAPLLIDAGCTAHPSKVGARYDWTDDDHASLTSQISERILKIWMASNGGNLWGKQFYLNVIVTHPDKDHKDLIPQILGCLEARVHAAHTSFIPFFLLGGRAHQYLGFLETHRERIIFSEQCPGIRFRSDLGFFDTSNCITHLFCPQGSAGNTSTDRNRWSIITRVQINGISALLPGDADHVVKGEMLSSLGGRKGELETDILLAPHHGADGTYNPEWDQLVDPRAIIIGAALMHNHPKGKTLLEFLRLKAGKGRVWRDRVMAHGLQYYCDHLTQKQIEDSLPQQEDRLFEKVPNKPVEDQHQPPTKQWHLAWVDLPIYTLWTTGSLSFEEELLTPHFLDTQHGLMGYIAVPDPKYLFSPYIREHLTPLSLPERELQEILSTQVKDRYGDEKESQYSNMLLKEALLIADHQDRSLYLNSLRRIFSETRPVLCRKTLSFRVLREGITERNTTIDRNQERVIDTANFLFRNLATLSAQGDADLSIALCDGAFNRNAVVFKTFLKSTHNMGRLRQYVALSSNIAQCGPSEDEIENLCPFGFAEWLQLGKLMEFFRNDILSPAQESINIRDVTDVSSLRRQGRNFKEIANFIIEEEGFIEWFQTLVRENTGNITFKTTKEEFGEKLEIYFPRALDDFLS